MHLAFQNRENHSKLLVSFSYLFVRQFVIFNHKIYLVRLLCKGIPQVARIRDENEHDLYKKP
jgi:hypothetical protein